MNRRFGASAVDGCNYDKEGTILQPWQEVRGVLQQVDTDELTGMIILRFGQKIVVAIPYNRQLKERFEHELGRNISILHTDLPDKQYLVIEERDPRRKF